jgi:multidrug transporter EmrE-like cation transporter
MIDISTSRHRGDRSHRTAPTHSRTTWPSSTGLVSLPPKSRRRSAPFEPLSTRSVRAPAWASALTAGVLHYGLEFWFYVTGLKAMTAGQAGLFINLVPVFGIAAGYLALDERLLGRQWLGAVIIFASIVLMTSVNAAASDYASSSLAASTNSPRPAGRLLETRRTTRDLRRL